MKTSNRKYAGLLGLLLLGLAVPGHAQPTDATKADNWKTFDVTLGPGEKPDTVSLFSIDTPALPGAGLSTLAGAGALADADTVWKAELKTPKLTYTLVLKGRPIPPAVAFDPGAEVVNLAFSLEQKAGTNTNVPVKLPGIQAAASLWESTGATGQKTDNLIASFAVRKRILDLIITFDPADNEAKKTAYGILTSARAADGIKTTRDGFTIEDLRVGDGPVAKAGQMVTVHYRGTLTNGQKFDASYDRGQPFQFGLGAGQVIKGWDQGVVGMKVGGKRKLIIPPALAYGDTGVGPIPPKSTLVFEVELLGVG